MKQKYKYISLIIMSFILPLSIIPPSLVSATTQTVYASDYTACPWLYEGKALGASDGDGAYVIGGSPSPKLDLFGFDSQDTFAVTSSITVQVRLKFSFSASTYDTCEITVAHCYQSADGKTQSKTTATFGKVTAYTWRSVSLSGDTITNLSDLHVKIRYKYLYNQDPPFPKLYVDCVKVTYESLTPYWSASSNSFSKHWISDESTIVPEGEWTMEVYDWVTSSKVHTRAKSYGYSDKTIWWKNAKIDGSSLFGDSYGDPIMFDVGVTDYYQLYMEVTFSYIIEGVYTGSINKKEFYNHLSFAAYATTQDESLDPPNTLAYHSNPEIRELTPPGSSGWPRIPTDIEGKNGDLKDIEGTTKRIWSAAKITLYDDERVFFPLDSSAQVICKHGSNGYGQVTIKYYNISIYWYVFKF